MNDKSETEKFDLVIERTYAQALEFAVITGRGSLLKAAPLPQADEQTVEYIPALCKQIEYMNGALAAMIDITSTHERQLHILKEMLDLHSRMKSEAMQGMRELRISIGSSFEELEDLQAEYNAIKIDE